MASNSSSVQPCDTDAADSTSIGAAAAADGADRPYSGRSHVEAASARAAEAMRNGPEDGHADCSSSASRDRGSTGTASVGANEAAGDHTDEDGDEDGEVFHSALQLAESELEGVGGCAALVHQDTLYGDMQVSSETTLRQSTVTNTAQRVTRFGVLLCYFARSLRLSDARCLCSIVLLEDVVDGIGIGAWRLCLVSASRYAPTSGSSSYLSLLLHHGNTRHTTDTTPVADRGPSVRSQRVNRRQHVM